MTFDKHGTESENVLKLIPQPEVKFVKSPRYRSIHSKRTIEQVARAKSAHKTLGQPCVGSSIRPSEYLRRGSGIRPSVTVHHVHYRKPLPALPKWCKTKGPRRCQVDFTEKNVELAKALAPKPAKFRHVDTKNGDTYELMPSGLVPVYVHKKNFGEVPSYSTRNKSAEKTRPAAKPASSCTAPQQRRVGVKSACRYITEEERINLLQGTKTKWSELMKQFQCLPFLIDTPPKVKRKAALENKLKELENDMQLIENHPYIYVYDDKA